MTKESKDINSKLFKSDAVNSLKFETEVYDLFKKFNWRTEHSPYYKDVQTQKNREIDVTARKLWRGNNSKDLSCEIDFIVECKSIKNYHIIASNKHDNQIASDHIHCWVGNDLYEHYKRTIQLLKKHELTEEKIKYILKEFHSHCYPEGLFKFVDCRVDAFDIPVFNSFRETNIGTTKELDTSVVWKAFQSLNSCAKNYQEFTWTDIDYFIYDIEREEFSNDEEKADALLDSLIFKSRHIKYVHPILVVESNMWELEETQLKELKYFRLLFQQVFDDGKWIDIVHKDHLEEYLIKTQEYDDFLKEKGFELN